MKRICKYCARQYEGDPGGSCCPDCAAAQRVTSVRERVCQTCGVTFSGGPRAWYCPDCRAERRRKADREHKARERAGAVRKLGSMDYCIVCGKPYTVTGSLQHYCPACAESAVHELDRAASKEWNERNTTPAQRREQRAAASAPISCAVCGALFVPRNASITCSKSCSEALRAQHLAQYEQQHRQERNRYRKSKRNEKLSSLSAEELADYHERVNRKARENYAKRKAEKERGKD